MQKRLSKFEIAMARTREKVTMRDNDIVLASFPKSGTHFLASVVSELFHNSTGKHVQSRANAPHQLFHGFPVFTLLPDNRAIPVPSHAFRFVASVPKHIPRIFLSHELVEDFEFELTPKTKVVYIMREPKAVYASFLRLYNRLSAGHHVLDSTLVAKEFLELNNGRQGMYFPARLEDDREVPVPFVWNRHVSGWLQYGLQHTNTFRMFSFNDDVLASAEAKETTIRSLVDFLLGADAHKEIDIQALVQKSSLSEVQQKTRLAQKDAEVHFHKGDAASWKTEFEQLPQSAQHVFEKIASESYDVLARQRKMAKLAKKLGRKLSAERRVWL